MPFVNDLAPGTHVQTPLGKGIVRESLNGGRVRVDIGTRSVVFPAVELSMLSSGTQPASAKRQAGTRTPQRSEQPRMVREIDLHGLTVEQALSRVDDALNDAILAGVTELRMIHGRSGGRIRGAVHKRLEEMSAVASFRLDPRNAGVTIVVI